MDATPAAIEASRAVQDGAAGFNISALVTRQARRLRVGAARIYGAAANTRVIDGDGTVPTLLEILHGSVHAATEPASLCKTWHAPAESC